MASRRVRVTGWGWEDQQPSQKLLDRVLGMLVGAGLAQPGVKRHGTGNPIVNKGEHSVVLPPPRFVLPAALQHLREKDTEQYNRLRCSRGQSLRDILRGLDTSNVVDYVLYPTRETDIQAVLRFASDATVAVIPRVSVPY